MKRFLLALYALLFCFGALTGTCEIVRVVVPGTNGWVRFDDLDFPVSGSCELEVPAGGGFEFGYVGQTNGSFTVASGRVTGVYGGSNGWLVRDETARVTHWFWYGFSLVFCAGLFGLGAKWTRRTITEGWRESD